MASTARAVINLPRRRPVECCPIGPVCDVRGPEPKTGRVEPEAWVVRLERVTVVTRATPGLDRDEFNAVYAGHYASLVRLACLTTGSLPAAEDLVQDAFVEWCRRGARVREPVPYLRRAVVSRCTSWVRRRRLERRHAHPPGDEATGWPAGWDGGADAAAIRAALARLTARQRAAVFLRYYLDLSEHEIADALDCRPGTVKSLLHRGLAAIKEDLR
jgi:RNA polymerase sigma-70 factor (sigma-E family)